MGKYNTKNRNNAISAYNQLKESNNKKKKVIWGLSVIALLSIVSTAGLLVFNNSGVSASVPTEETQRIEELQQSNTELSELIEKMESNKKELESKIVSLSNDKNALSGEVSELKETIKLNQANINSLTNQLATLDSQISIVRQEKVALENQIVELESREVTSREEIESLQIQLKSKEAELIELTNQKDALNHTIISKNTEINNLQNRLSELENQINVLETRVSELSKGRYTLSIENTEINMTRLEFNLDRNNFTDITSIDGEGNVVPYETIGITNYWGGDYEQHIFYYFNGTVDNGSYAMRTINVYNEDFNVKINDIYADEYSIDLEQKNSLSYSDFTFESLSNKYTEFGTLNIYIQKMEDGFGTTILPDSEPFVLENNTYYILTVDGQLGNGENSGFVQTQYILSTNTSGIYRIHDGENIEVNSSGITENGDYQINFNGNGLENMTLTVTKRALREIVKNDNQWYLQQETTTVTSEGDSIYTHGAGYGDDRGLKNMNMIINTPNGRMNLCLDISHMIKEYQKWEEEHPQNELGIEVAKIDYFENGKGFEDTPEVTNIYVEGNYTIFEFNAFNQIGNKLYIETNSEGSGYVELADGDTTRAVMSVFSQRMDEVVIDIGYALPGTHLHITIIPV